MACVLVVDDDVDTGDLLAELLGAEGHDVQVARNGQEGLTLLRAKRPDIALLDVEMPVLTGPEMAYEMLLHDRGWEEIPVVLLSGVLNLREVAAAVGTPYFLGKPYAAEPILALAERVLTERTPPHPPPRE